jgi:hypothetical protein
MTMSSQKRPASKDPFEVKSKKGGDQGRKKVKFENGGPSKKRQHRGDNAGLPDRDEDEFGFAGTNEFEQEVEAHLESRKS